MNKYPHPSTPTTFTYFKVELCKCFSEGGANLCPNLTALLRDQTPIKISHHLQVQLWNMIWQPNSWTAQNNILAREFSLWI